MAQKKYKLLISFHVIWASVFILLGTVLAQEENKVPAKKTPVITITNPSYDIGEVEEGSPITHTYIIKNNGADELKIESVKPT